MAKHRASPTTVQRAMSRLAAEGVVEPRPGVGTFVPQSTAAPSPAPDLSWQQVALGAGRRVDAGGLDVLLALPRPGAIPLSSGYLDAGLQPTAALQAAMSRASRRPGAWDRVPVEGVPELRAWFATHADCGLRSHDVLVCSGGQAALGTTLRALARPGDVLLVESPTYIGALAAARNAGLTVMPVPADNDGVRPDLLADALTRTGARLVYLQPLYANPHGATLAHDRRAAVLDAVAQAGAFIIEDDWARDMPIAGDRPPPLAADDPDGHVILLRSLTKVAAPGLRIAMVAARGAAGARLRAVRHVDDFFVSGPLQQAALELVSAPGWRRHLKQLSGALRERRDALAAAVARDLPDLRLAPLPGGGLHLWGQLPDHVDDVRLAADAAGAGVVVFAGTPFFAADAPGSFLRLTFGATEPANLAEGVRRLAGVLPAGAA